MHQEDFIRLYMKHTLSLGRKCSVLHYWMTPEFTFISVIILFYVFVNFKFRVFLCLYNFFMTGFVTKAVRLWLGECASVEQVHRTVKDNHEAITVRALHALLSRVTYSEQIAAPCWAQGHFDRTHGSWWTHLIFSGNQTCDLYIFREAS